MRHLITFLWILVTTSIGAEMWKAKWITANFTQNEPNTWLCFRKVQAIDSIPKTAIAQIAADSKYWLWINGKPVVFEGGLKRGPNPLDTYYDEVDIAPYMQKGENIIALLVWYFGKDGFSHISSGKAGLLFQCITPNFEILSDASWKSRRHPAFGTCENPKPNFRLSESSIRFDARQDIASWHTLDYKEKSWSKAYAFGDAPMAPWNNLVLRPIPQWKNSGLVEYVNKASLPTESTGESIEGILPANIQITPYLKIDAPEGLVIQIKTDNFQGGSEPNMYAEYITKQGEQEFESFGWINGQKVIYTIPKGVKILALKYRETGYDTDFSGNFNCSDDFYNRLWQKARRTLYVTMRDNYMDCPDRERAQWWGDEVIEGGEAFYALCPKSHLLMRKGMLELIGWQKKNGILFSPIPAGNWNQELPCQSLATIGLYGFWNYYMHTGDKQTIADNYDGVKRYLEIYKLKDDGTLVYRQGGWPWGDWGEQVDIEFIQSCWYQLALLSAKNMALLLGKSEDAKLFTQQMESFRTAVNKSFWTGKEYRHYDYKGTTDDRAQAMAVLSGIAEKSQYPALFEIFKTTEYASPYMEKYVMEALFHMGQESYALGRAKKRFDEMVNHPTYTTLFEGWGIGKKGYGGGTWNHAWSGGALTILMQYVCGISPIEAGYSKFAVMPQPGTMTQATASVHSVKGIITTSFINDASKFELTVNVPQTTKAVLGIPVSSANKITLNGSSVWESGKAIKHDKIINTYTTETHICFEVSSGKWDLKTTKK
ncbi:MAG: glycoside hydrolase [Fibrobacteres bacterium]|nr:glycoside hydrolase [Fibrobacterota bacterium]